MIIGCETIPFTDAELAVFQKTHFWVKNTKNNIFGYFSKVVWHLDSKLWVYVYMHIKVKTVLQIF